MYTNKHTYIIHVCTVVPIHCGTYLRVTGPRGSTRCFPDGKRARVRCLYVPRTPVSALFRRNNIAGAEPKPCCIIAGSRAPFVRGQNLTKKKKKIRKKEHERGCFFPGHTIRASFIDDFVTSCFDSQPPGISGLYNDGSKTKRVRLDVRLRAVTESRRRVGQALRRRRILNTYRLYSPIQIIKIRIITIMVIKKKKCFIKKKYECSYTFLRIAGVVVHVRKNSRVSRYGISPY